MKIFYCDCFFLLWGEVMVRTGWVGLCVITEETKIYPHFRVVKNPYPKMIPKAQTKLGAYTVEFL
jgi:hypothetical protein